MAILRNSIILIDNLVSTIIFLLAIKIYVETKKDPLKLYEYDKYDYSTLDLVYSLYPTVPPEEQISKIPVGLILNYIFAQEGKKNKGKYNLRNLNNECDNEIKNEVDKKGLDAFDLGINLVHKMALGIIIVKCCIWLAVIIILIARCGMKCCAKDCPEDCPECLLLFYIVL